MGAFADEVEALPGPARPPAITSAKTRFPGKLRATAVRAVVWSSSSANVEAQKREAPRRAAPAVEGRVFVTKRSACPHLAEAGNRSRGRRG